MEKTKIKKILIDIGHPAHIHYFRNLAFEFQKKGSEILFTTRDKEITIQLLDYYGFNYVSFGKPFKSRIGKVLGLFWFTLRVFIIALKFKPDIYLNASMYDAIVAWLFRKPHISLEDTFNMEQVKLYRPFTSVILTGDYDHPNLGMKQISYSGYQELAYLHPLRFEPDPSIKTMLGVPANEEYVILRFVSWNATHDFGHLGISDLNKVRMIKKFSKYVKVFISSETKLTDELERYRIKLSPEKMHDAIAFASLIYGESATMVSEGAMLGVPGIFLDNTGRFYTKEQEEKYGLVFNFTESLDDQEKSINKGVELLTTSGINAEWQKKRKIMLADKIDITAFMIWFIENYPESAKIMKENPEYQERFK